MNLLDRPKDVKAYKLWLKNTHGLSTDEIEKWYGSVATRLEVDFSRSALWNELIRKLNEFDQDYFTLTGYNLLTSYDRPKLNIKPFESFIEKTYRKNILENENWPSEPNGGWLLPANWFSRISDILRTTFVVKYLDGVQFLVSKFESVSKTHNFHFKVNFEGREEGYYAAHIYVRNTFEIPKIKIQIHHFIS